MVWQAQQKVRPVSLARQVGGPLMQRQSSSLHSAMSECIGALTSPRDLALHAIPLVAAVALDVGI